MQIIQLDDKARDEFLAQQRLAILSTNGMAGYPVSVPLRTSTFLRTHLRRVSLSQDFRAYCFRLMYQTMPWPIASQSCQIPQ